MEQKQTTEKRNKIMKQKLTDQEYVFHGELSITPVETTPLGEVTKHKSFVAAHSETGHNHVLECDVEFDRIMTDNGIYIRLYDVAKIVHKKDHAIHETKILSPGTYRFGEKTEYDPLRKVTQRVFD